MKSKKVFDLKNKFDKFIFGLIESRENGDWDEYEDEEVIEYIWDLRKESWFDVDFNFDSLSEYIDEGIDYGDGYEVSLDDYEMIVEIVYKELD
jgi:hypothetical protein